MPERLTMPREKAVVGDDGKRRCAFCGGEIDPKDWCPGCARGDCTVHRRPMKRADAAFCDAGCRSQHRSTFARDCR